MARPLRIEYPGAVYHVTTRGNAGQAIFLTDRDRGVFLDTYAEVSSRMQWRCLAYCLMKDHYHLVVETPKPNLSKGMRQLNGVYTQRFNQLHHRGGHLFQGRYKAILIERSRYLTQVCRHVVLNPVRHGLVRKPAAWKWSSYRATAGLENAPSWLDERGLLSEFGKQINRARLAYVEYVEKGKNATLWEALRHQIYLGGEAFIKRLQTKPKLIFRNGKRRSAKGRGEKHQRLSHLKRHTHNAKRTMAVAYLSGHYTLNEIADHFNVHYSTVSRAVKDYEHAEQKSGK